MSASASTAVFLSYAREDLDAARRIAEALRGFGVEVWFDQSELRGGEAWDEKIRRQIHECALFLAVISAHTQARHEGYFRREWKLAVERTSDMAEGVPFLVPVAVDDTAEAGALVPAEFLRVQWTRLPGGLPSPQFIEQIKRLLAPAADVGRGLPTPPLTRPTAGPAGSGDPALHRKPRIPSWAWAVGALAVVGTIAFFATRHSAPPIAPSKPVAEAKAPVSVIPEKSIAVLPFENLSDDKDTNAFFADGIHEDILTHLVRIRELRVISRTSVMEYRGKAGNLRDIAKKLGVAYILEGSVRRAGNQVRITGQLIRAATDEHLWAKSYDRELTAKEVFGIQAELAQEIAAALKTAISPEEKSQLARRPTESLAAYELYLQAREISRQQTLEHRRREELLQAAVQLDPKFAIAWGALGVLHVGSYRGRLSGLYDHTPARLASAKSATETALRLAPDDAEVMIAAAYYYWRIDGDLKRAAELNEQAAQREPNNVNVMSGLASVRTTQGRWAEALVFRGLLSRLDPASVAAANTFANLLEAGRRYDEARSERVRQTKLKSDAVYWASQLAYLSFLAQGSMAETDQLEASLAPKRAPLILRAFRMRELVRGQLGNYVRLLERSRRIEARSFRSLEDPQVETAMWADSAVASAVLDGLAAGREKIADLAELKTQLKSESDNPLLWAAVATREALLGNKEDALLHAKKAVELQPMDSDRREGPVFATVVAFVFAWTGEKDRALAEYARLLRTPFSGLNVHEMKVHPRYAPLRGDPRWEALLNDPKNNAPLF